MLQSRPVRRLRAAALLIGSALLGTLSGCTAGTAPVLHRTESVSSGALGSRSRSRVPRVNDRTRRGRSELSPAVRGMRRVDVLRALHAGTGSTYIGEILLGRDSALTRWPDRVTRPLTVWVASAAGTPGWDPAFQGEVLGAFEAWSRTGIPVRFVAADSASADIHVTWVDRFREPISGKTIWTRDDDWWIVDADITLALHHRDGAPLDAAQVRAIALHEIGHLIGLDHTADATNIMAPKVRVRDLSPSDAATARLLYTLPAGRLR
jgi:hypothetical protein